MKRLLAVLMILVLAVSMVACDLGKTNGAESTEEATTTAGATTQPEEPTEAPTTEPQPEQKPSGVMTHAEYMAAELDAAVVVEGYVQATQSWWDNKITVYLQDEDGAYYLYEMACTEENAAKLVPGTKIKVSGYKAAWDGEIEIIDATFEFAGTDTYIAEATDVTALLGNNDELVKHQNEFVVFTEMTVESISYKNDEPGDDIYVNLKKGDATYSFCVERYLTGPDTELYAAVGALKAGDVIDVEGFLYWWNGPNTHITAVTASPSKEEVANKKSEGTMTYAEYDAAALDSAVVVEGFVQATQSWWDNKITVYLQDGDGAYYLYEMACTEENAAKLVPGTKIKVSGYKAAWDGEIEIIDATFEFAGTDTYIAEATDVTALLGNNDELLKHQNKFVVFTDMTVESITYKNEEPGDDIYVNLKKGDATYSFCVERYLTGPDTELYAAVGALKAGDVIDVEGFLYWWNGPNTHITAVSK